MWTCPDCGRAFANRSQWHSCLDLSVEDHLSDKSELAVSIYRAVVESLEHCGQFRVHSQKTRIAFISRMTFAGVKLARRWADLSFITATPVDDRRIRRLELYGPTSWGHTIRLDDPEALDDEVLEWLCESLRRGDRETLDSNAEVVPLTGHLLSVFWTGFRAQVAGGTIRFPGYVSEALALADEVVVRISGVDHRVSLADDHGVAYFEAPPELGLGSGDHVDVFVRVE